MTEASSFPAPSERIAVAVKALIASGESINGVSSQLAKPIASLERSLKRLNLGVACWTMINSGTEGEDHYWSQEVGHSRINRRWCLAIRTIEGPEHDPERMSLEEWPFSDAPRHLRAKAVDKLPDLIEALVKVTDATASRLKKKVAPAQEVASVVNELISPKKDK